MNRGSLVGGLNGPKKEFVWEAWPFVWSNDLFQASDIYYGGFRVDGRDPKMSFKMGIHINHLSGIVPSNLRNHCIILISLVHMKDVR